MSETIRLGQFGSRGQIKFHELTLEGNTVQRTHGQVGGKIIEVPTDVYQAVNVGKANEKSPDQVAKEAFDKYVYDRKRDGYMEVNDWSEVKQQTVDVAALFRALPDELCMSKPIAEISPAAWTKLIRRGRIRYQLKENGMCHFAFIGGEYGTRLLTRRMFDHSDKYRDIIAELESSFPARTMVVVELYVDDPTKSHMARFQLMQSITKSDCRDGRINDIDLPETIRLRALHQVRARVLIVPIYAGELTLQLSEETWVVHRAGVHGPLLTLPPDLPHTCTLEQAIEYAKANGIEGGVLWDLDAAVELTMTGKPARRAAYKVKPVYDIDLVATGWVPEKNKDNGKIGALIIQEVVTVDGVRTFVDRGTVGSGLKDENSDPAGWTFPCVITIQFSERHEDTDNFQFARIVGVHPDKTVDEL